MRYWNRYITEKVQNKNGSKTSRKQAVIPFNLFLMGIPLTYSMSLLSTFQENEIQERKVEWNKKVFKQAYSLFFLFAYMKKENTGSKKDSIELKWCCNFTHFPQIKSF